VNARSVQLNKLYALAATLLALSPVTGESQMIHTTLLSASTLPLACKIIKLIYF
jgi:hypothetical protein